MTGWAIVIQHNSLCKDKNKHSVSNFVMVYKAISHVALLRMCLIFPALTLLTLNNRILYFPERQMNFIYWVQLSRFHLNTERDWSLRNGIFKKKKKTERWIMSRIIIVIKNLLLLFLCSGSDAEYLLLFFLKKIMGLIELKMSPCSPRSHTTFNLPTKLQIFLLFYELCAFGGHNNLVLLILHSRQ
jgi:hypothetical protein